ncbi:MAG TPA: asparagine--tRNA ligase [bacterium]|nr:asparagine--tRNA ligase [bacterium]
MAEARGGRVPIHTLLQSTPDGREVRVHGWVRTRRDSKAATFVELNDGSCLANLQVVFDVAQPTLALPDDATTGASLIVHGRLVESPAKGQPVELQAERFELVGGSTPEFPLQKKRHGFEYLRTIAHLRLRSNTFGAVARVRNALYFAIHEYFQTRGFMHVPAPMITANDAEGAGEMFTVTTLDPAHPPLVGGQVDWSQDFFGRKASLTVSGQLEAEAFAHVFHDVYSFAATFRAENSNTSRHAAEFLMCEPEMAFADLQDNIRLGEDFIKTVLAMVRERCPEDMTFFDQRIEPGLLAKLDHVMESPFEILSYTEAVRLLEASGETFEFPVAWGHDLQSEHERYLTEKQIGRPVFVVDYPRDIKAFYMRRNDDGRTVAAMDMLVPGIGEIIGGSQREERLDVLEASLRERGMGVEDYGWYLDLRRFGSVPHAGFGVGFERLLMYITGLTNIRDALAFPRTPGHVEF